MDEAQMKKRDLAKSDLELVYSNKTANRVFSINYKEDLGWQRSDRWRGYGRRRIYEGLSYFYSCS